MSFFSLSKSKVGLLLVVLTFFLSLSATAQDKDWRQISPNELSTKTPIVEPDADAEAIFWEVRVDDSAVSELALKHYVRVKIYTERGREQFSKHDILFPKGTKIKDVEARVTKPDGTSVFLKKDDVMEREIVKTNGFKIKAKSFALPGLEIGSIVEYKYKEVVEDGQANMRLVFQRELPIQTISYYVKPYSGNRAMAFQSFNTTTNFEKDKDGFYRATMNKLRAYKEEPSGLPEDEVRSWIYIYYTADTSKDSNEYWSKVSKALYDVGKNSMKANDEVKAATAQAIAGASTDDEKLKRIYDFAKTQIKNITYAENVSDDEKKKAEPGRSAGDILKSRMGTANDVDVLFGAMARSAGYDARLALSGDRSDLFFNPRIPNLNLMLNSSSVAVKVGNEWRFFSPASYFATYGMLSWNEEGQMALITDSKELIWQKIPLAPAEKSMEKRSGKFKILEDGTLEGEARIEFTGHAGSRQKMSNRGDSPTAQEKNLKDLIKSNILGTAEVDSISIENARDPEKPIVYTFKIRVPGYASRTGKRIFFQPNVFERSSKPRFVSSSRQSDVYFSYPFSEQDDITIDLPAGFSLESGDTPGAYSDQQGIGKHETTIGVTTDGKTVSYKRSFSFGNGGFIRFPVDSYGPIKMMFENFNKADVHQLTLRQDSK